MLKTTAKNHSNLLLILGPTYAIAVLAHQLIIPSKVFHFQFPLWWVAIHLFMAFSFQAWLTVPQFKTTIKLFFISLVLCGGAIMLIYQQPQYCLKGNCNGSKLLPFLLGGLSWAVLEMTALFSWCLLVGWIMEYFLGFDTQSHSSSSKNAAQPPP